MIEILSNIPALEMGTSNPFSILEHFTFLDQTSFVVDLSRHLPQLVPAMPYAEQSQNQSLSPRGQALIPSTTITSE